MSEDIRFSAQHGGTMPDREAYRLVGYLCALIRHGHLRGPHPMYTMRILRAKKSA